VLFTYTIYQRIFIDLRVNYNSSHLWNAKKTITRIFVTVAIHAVAKEFAVIASNIIAKWESYRHVIFLMTWSRPMTGLWKISFAFIKNAGLAGIKIKSGRK